MVTAKYCRVVTCRDFGRSRSGGMAFRGEVKDRTVTGPSITGNDIRFATRSEIVPSARMRGASQTHFTGLRPRFDGLTAHIEREVLYPQVGARRCLIGCPSCTPAYTLLDAGQDRNSEGMQS